MAEGDKDKTTFFAGEGVFCYRKMPFGLKNAGATYQRLVDKVFHDQIGRNLEAYVDDMVIKSTSEEDMLADIKETFERATLNGGQNYEARIILAVDAQRRRKGPNGLNPNSRNVAKDDKGRTKEVTKKKEGKEVASIEEAYYQNKLRRKIEKMMKNLLLAVAILFCIDSWSWDVAWGWCLLHWDSLPRHKKGRGEMVNTEVGGFVVGR
ncbi:reverse transcriptase domain-containing protein [Tanacetum coccineum]